MAERTAGEQAIALGWFAIEVYWCAECAVRRTSALIQDDAVVANACLEAMLVHARAVLDFLLNESRFPSDIRRSDFPGSGWEAPESEEVAWLREDIVVINKHLAHLTWERVDDSLPPWREVGFAARVVALAADWVTHLAKADSALAAVARPWIFFAERSVGLISQDAEPPVGVASVAPVVSARWRGAQLQ